MGDIETTIIQPPDLSQVGETVRSLVRGIRGAGSGDEPPSFAATLAATDGSSQNAAPDLTRGGRRAGDTRTAESQAMMKRSRDHAVGAQLRTTLAPPSQANNAISTLTPVASTQGTPGLVAQVASSRGIDVVPVWANDPVTLSASARSTAAERTQAAYRVNDPSATPSSSWAKVHEGGTTTGADTSRLSLKQYPKPAKDRSGVLSWTSTTPPSDAETDQLLAEAKRRQVGWVTFSVDPDRVDEYDRLAKRITVAGLQPIARIQDTEGDLPTADVADTVQYLRGLGVRYYQLFDGANLASQSPDDRVDVNDYAERWLRSAQAVIANGGLPGIGALAPKGDYDDLGFMRQLMSTLKERGGQDVLGRAWMAMQGTAPSGTATADDTGDLVHRAEWYDRLARHALGQSLPILATLDPSGRGEPLTSGSGTTDTSTIDQAERTLRSRRRQLPALFAASRGSLERARV